jgi:hypothetical protein
MRIRLFFGFSTWLLVTFSLLLTACGPSYYLAVQPTELEAEAINAPQTLFAELDGVEMEITFSHFRIGDAVYQAEIRNGSSQSVVVEFRGVQSAPSTTNTSALLPPVPVPAHDPEAEVQPLSTRVNIANDVVMGVTEIEWIVIRASITQEAIAKRRRAMQRVRNSPPAAPHLQNEQAKQNDINVLTAQELALWQGPLLRRYDLQPGELIRGYVVFPSYAESGVLRITAPVGPHVFTFDYAQKRLKY